MQTRTTRAAAALALPLFLGLGACSGADQAAPAGNSTTAATSEQAAADPFTVAPGTQVDVATFLGETQKAQQDKKTFHMQMTMSAQGQKITMTGDQDVSDPNKPKATLTMSAPGQTGGVDMIMDGESVYLKMPGQAGGKFVKMSMQDLAAQGGVDFKKMMNPSESLKAQQQAIDAITFKGEEDVSGEKLRRYALVIDPVKAQKAAGATNVPAPTGTAAAKIPYDVWVDSGKLVRKMQLTQNGATIDMAVSKYGEPVKVAAPPAAQVTTAPAMPGSQPAPSAS
ncbi:DUF7537 family lipoprotein [Agilicoccus flavus]|uniref:DUF7537 family lipoprotein n=1 Tax=Agilicoccus flavus TaxID=2775968 RepID=UPI001CF6B1CD|nr:LppX_LprAFG lipoprotein [Agilicoccus flavus]